MSIRKNRESNVNMGEDRNKEENPSKTSGGSKKWAIGKKILAVAGIAFAALILFMAVGILRQLGYFNPGNNEKYNVSNVETLKDSPLTGKKIIFLGSSVTQGMQSMGTSFVEYMAKRDSINYIKEAVSGTTLVDNGDKSYISRMKTIDTTYNADIFVCQLSTNDATKNYPLGEISDSRELKDLDTSTITGAMEYIICYAQNTWNCPVVFYTGTYYDSKNYGMMVERLLELQEKWGITVIDLWDNQDMRQISGAQKAIYLNDGSIHPTKAGYLEWWTPVMEETLYQVIDQR